MSQAATRTSDKIEAPTILLGGFDAVQKAWRRSLEASADTAQALQAEHAQFAGKLVDLNVRAVRSLGDSGAASDRFVAPFELGASAVELYLGYLRRSTALAQKAMVLPWAKDEGQA